MNAKDLLAFFATIQLPCWSKDTVMSMPDATGRRCRMKQERQLVEKILRALPRSSRSRPGFLRAHVEQTGRAASTMHSSRMRLTSPTTLCVGPGDDAAILSPSGETDWVLSCDASIEGVHFHIKTHPADSVGYKSLARATSDLAAMGAMPSYFLLNLALPHSRAGRWLDQFLKGMARASRELGMTIIGGDTTASETVSISVTVLGEAAPGTAVARSGARPGDLIYVSGKLGRAQLGLDLVFGGESLNPKFRADVQPHLYPKIQIALGSWLASKRIPTAMMDISDGLSTDLTRLCKASHIGAQIYAHKIPSVKISGAAARKLRKRELEPLQLALHGGEDYELLLTVSPARAKELRDAPGSNSLVAIGEIVRGKKILLIDAAGKASALKPLGWDPL
jgi:thiamine-monophosphate kinase